MPGRSWGRTPRGIQSSGTPGALPKAPAGPATGARHNGREETLWMMPHRRRIDNLAEHGVPANVIAALHASLDDAYRHGAQDANVERATVNGIREVLGMPPIIDGPKP